MGKETDAELIGFLTYTRQFVSGAAPKNAPNVHNMGIGALGNVEFPMLGEYHSLKLFSHFVHSDVTDANLLTGNIVYSPTTGPLVGRPVYLFETLAAFLTPQAKVVYTRVLDAGTAPILISNSDSTRAGGRLELLLMADGGPFNGFSLRTAYEYLKFLDGPLNSIDRFESVLSYKLPDQQFWSIDLRYTKGRNLDTLDKQHQIVVGLGFKY